MLWTAPLDALAGVVADGPARAAARAPRPRARLPGAGRGPLQRGRRPLRARRRGGVRPAVGAEELPHRPRPRRARPCCAPRCRPPPATRRGRWATPSSVTSSSTACAGSACASRPSTAVAVRRQARVYPVLRSAPTARDTALAWSDTLDGVTVLGRQGLHVADNLHHVLDMALAAAGCLGTGDDGWDARAVGRRAAALRGVRGRRLMARAWSAPLLVGVLATLAALVGIDARATYGARVSGRRAAVPDQRDERRRGPQPRRQRRDRRPPVPAVPRDRPRRADDAARRVRAPGLPARPAAAGDPGRCRCASGGGGRPRPRSPSSPG